MNENQERKPAFWSMAKYGAVTFGSVALGVLSLYEGITTLVGNSNVLGDVGLGVLSIHLVIGFIDNLLDFNDCVFAGLYQERQYAH